MTAGAPGITKSPHGDAEQSLKSGSHQREGSAAYLTLLQRETVVHWSDASGCWCSHDHWAYRYEYATHAFHKIFRIPPKSQTLLGRWRDVLARSWLKRRFWPSAGIQNLVGLPGRGALVIHDRVYWYSPQEHQRVAETLESDICPSMAAPLRGGIAVHPVSHSVYYGEYLNGHQRDIRIARVDLAARKIEVCWSFARSEIKHVHALHYDRFRNRLWVCTGDLDHESAFYYTDDEFRSLHRFAGGDQSWRAIALLFDETGMEWGMDAGKDAPTEAINRIYRHDFVTGQRTERAIIANPAYAACEFADGTAMMQTTFEPGRKQDTPEQAGLWYRGEDRQWRPCLGLPFVPHPRVGVGRYAMIWLPQGISPTDQLLCTPVNCHTGHYSLMVLRQFSRSGTGPDA